MSLTTLFAQTYSTGYTTTTTTTGSTGAGLLVFWLIILAFAIITVVALWKIFQKAGRPGWAAIVPIYNTWVQFEIVGYPGWWAVLGLVPIVNLFPAVMSLVAEFKLAKLFGKSDVFAVCTILFPWVCLPMLAFGDATFQGGQSDSGVTAPQAPANPVV